MELVTVQQDVVLQRKINLNQRSSLMVANANHGQKNLSSTTNSARSKGKASTGKTRKSSATKGKAKMVPARKRKSDVKKVKSGTKKTTAKKLAVSKKSIPGAFRAISRSDGEPKPKIYIPDANVFMHNPGAINKFNEHPVVVCGQVWYELDGGKTLDKNRSNSEASKNARDVHNYLDGLTAGKTLSEIKSGLVLVAPTEVKNGRPHTGKIFFDFYQPLSTDFVSSAVRNLDMGDKDNRILLSCLSIARLNKTHQVILVTNDRNFRVKARVFGIDTEAPLSEEMDNLPSPEEEVQTGFHKMPENFWDKIGDNFRLTQEGAVATYEFTHAMFKNIFPNQFILIPGLEEVELRVIEKPSSHKVIAMTFSHHDYNKVMVPRDISQRLALELAMDPKVTALQLAGMAGSGKTFLALAVAYYLVVEERLYDKVIVTRSVVPSDEDIGFVPGTEEEKMQTWLNNIDDNLEALIFKGNEGEVSIEEMKNTIGHTKERMNIQLKSIGFMKGRSFKRTIIIVDEDQDLSREKMKMLCTRPEDSSKILFMGNAAQIGNKYLSESTCGVSIFIRTFLESMYAAHITMQEGQRGNFATEAESWL